MKFETRVCIGLVLFAILFGTFRGRPAEAQVPPGKKETTPVALTGYYRVVRRAVAGENETLVVIMIRLLNHGDEDVSFERVELQGVEGSPHFSRVGSSGAVFTVARHAKTTVKREFTVPARVAESFNNASRLTIALSSDMTGKLGSFQTVRLQRLEDLRGEGE